MDAFTCKIEGILLRLSYSDDVYVSESWLWVAASLAAFQVGIDVEIDDVAAQAMHQKSRIAPVTPYLRTGLLWRARDVSNALCKLARLVAS